VKKVSHSKWGENKNPATEIAGFFLSENRLCVLPKAAQYKKASDTGQ
jgi:hypothetical protein